MELRHLRYFVTVAEELNFSKAALRLHTAQPSLSQQIKDLEKRLGIQLFNRTKRKVELTSEGESFLPYAQSTLLQADLTIQKTQKVANELSNCLSISFGPVAELKIFPNILPSLRFDYPDLKLNLQSMNEIQQQKALEAGQIDIGFIRENLTGPDLRSCLLFREKLIFLLPKTHPLCRYETIPIRALDHEALIIASVEHAPTLHRSVMHFAKQHNIKFNFIQHAGNILFNINSVNMGLGCAILPSYIEPMIKNHPNIAIRSLEIEPPLIDLFMSYNTKNNQKNIEIFINAIQNKKFQQLS
ncbi:LysR substrate-binding domain-containing protein [Acinetobacter rudis]|uniref:LysR substrate-binding domain-containing protein n=1 Tax=Acinetobacter rudis TaxID=632955 RepID=UPI00280C9921|nr:LysR substrate-binding domain-containing protein [Acinetobacter rudis]MDQ8953718.1 LysR substrate-binding domain-containing protein [Acinetobacter rudis]